MKKRTKEEQRIYMAAWRERQRQKQQESKGLRDLGAPATGATTIEGVTEQAVPVVTPEVAQVPVAPVAEPEKKLTAAEILRRVAPAPDDDCQTCKHAWHNDEDGCREPLDRRRRCGCKLYRSAADVLAALGVDPSEDPF